MSWPVLHYSVLSCLTETESADVPLDTVLPISKAGFNVPSKKSFSVVHMFTIRAIKIMVGFVYEQRLIYIHSI